MALRLRYYTETGKTLGYSIERLADGLYWDFTNSVFTASPALQIQSLPESTGNFTGRYLATLANTPQAQFTDGNYAVTIHDLDPGVVTGIAIDGVQVEMFAGDDMQDRRGYRLASDGLDLVLVLGQELRRIVGAIALSVLGRLTAINNADGTGSTTLIAPTFTSPGTPQISAAQTPTSRTVTVTPET